LVDCRALITKKQIAREWLWFLGLFALPFIGVGVDHYVERLAKLQLGLEIGAVAYGVYLLIRSII